MLHVRQSLKLVKVSHKVVLLTTLSFNQLLQGQICALEVSVVFEVFIHFSVINSHSFNGRRKNKKNPVCMSDFNTVLWFTKALMHENCPSVDVC